MCLARRTHHATVRVGFEVAAPAAGQGASAFDRIRAAMMSRVDEMVAPCQPIGMLEVMAFSAMDKQRRISQLEDDMIDAVSEL